MTRTPHPTALSLRAHRFDALTWALSLAGRMILMRRTPV